MRSHADIVTEAGEDSFVRKLKVKPHQPRDWRIRNSIPAEHWSAIARARLATLTELAEAAAAKGRE